MVSFQPALILGLAALLDYGLGDPWHWWHPVQGMGWVISHYTRWALAYLKSPLALRIAGIGLGLGLIFASGLLGWGAIAIATAIYPWAGVGMAVILLASCFAGRSLRDAAEEVLYPLEQGDLEQARCRLSRYVGRDTANLSEAEVLRAILETVTENATDGVMAPLFYAIVGGMVPAIGSAPLALAYKAASTLDSMVGYRKPPYTDLGWFSARLEDGLSWLPCRLVVLTVGLMSGRPAYVWRLSQRDAVKDPSPNSGWSECAYAAALGVQMGGTNYYRGVASYKPLLGEPIQPITPAIVRQALQLTRWSYLLWLGVGMAWMMIRWMR